MRRLPDGFSPTAALRVVGLLVLLLGVGPFGPAYRAAPDPQVQVVAAAHDGSQTTAAAAAPAVAPAPVWLPALVGIVVLLAFPPRAGPVRREERFVRSRIRAPGLRALTSRRSWEQGGLREVQVQIT